MSLTFLPIDQWTEVELDTVTHALATCMNYRDHSKWSMVYDQYSIAVECQVLTATLAGQIKSALGFYFKHIAKTWQPMTLAGALHPVSDLSEWLVEIDDVIEQIYG